MAMTLILICRSDTVPFLSSVAGLATR